GRVIDDARRADLGQPEVAREIGACRRLVRGRCELADGDRLAGADRRLVETLLLDGKSRGRRAVGDDFSDPQMIVPKHLEAALLLHAVMLAVRAPANHRLLVAPS